MATPENPYAGQGAVLLDIGGDVGALIVAMPPSTEGLEVEIRPAGATAGLHRHRHGHGHEHRADPHDDHSPSHEGGHGPEHEHAAYPHVAVVARPTGAGPAYSLVYPSVPEGRYELCPLPHGEVAITVAVAGGAVTQATWPS